MHAHIACNFNSNTNALNNLVTRFALLLIETNRVAAVIDADGASLVRIAGRGPRHVHHANAPRQTLDPLLTKQRAVF